MTALDDLVVALEQAAALLEQGNVYQRAWAQHLRTDAQQVRLLALGWHAPTSDERVPVGGAPAISVREANV